MVRIASQPATRTQKRALNTRQRLLKAALSMFATKGVDATTIEDITERADLGKGTFYRHFTSKEALVLALAEYTVNQLVAQMRGSAGTHKHLDDALAGLLKAHAVFFTAHRDEFAVLFEGRRLLRPEKDENSPLEAPLGAYLSTIAALLSPHLPSPVDAGRVRKLACAIARFFSGFFSFALMGVQDKEIERSYEPIQKAFVAASIAHLHSAPATTPAAEPTTTSPRKEEKHDAHTTVV